MIVRLVIVLSIIFTQSKVQSQISDEVFQILDRYYVCVYNSTVNSVAPKVIQYKDDVINMILENRNKFVVKNLEGKPARGPLEKKLPDPTRQWTDTRGFSYELMRGDVRASNRKMIVTKDDYKIFSMIPDREAIYFLAKPANGPDGEGSLFAMSTTAMSTDMISSEYDILGDRITAMGIDSKTGNLALSFRGGQGWNIIVLRRTGRPAPIVVAPPEPVVTTPKITTVIPKPTPKPPNVIPKVTPRPAVRTTPKPTTKATPKPKLLPTDEEFNEILAESILRIRSIYENKLSVCKSLEVKAEMFLKKYSRILELLGTDDDGVRKDNLPKTLLSKKVGDENIITVLDGIQKSLKAAYIKNKNS